MVSNNKNNRSNFDDERTSLSAQNAFGFCLMKKKEAEINAYLRGLGMPQTESSLSKSNSVGLQNCFRLFDDGFLALIADFRLLYAIESSDL